MYSSNFILRQYTYGIINIHVGARSINNSKTALAIPMHRYTTKFNFNTDNITICI